MSKAPHFENECEWLRMSFEPGEPLSKEDERQAAEHLFICDDCRAWKEQMTTLLAVARQAPQFDVPEALTQSILARASESRIDGARPKGEFWLLGACVIAAAAALFVLDSFESVNGSLSWLVSFVAIALAKCLIDGTRTEGRHALQK